MKLCTLEWLRGAAALSVAVAHADSMFGSNPALPFGHWHSWSFPGTAGVEFFFVLSGFVMGVAHGHQLLRGGSPLRFLWRRVCRIYPLFWLLLAVPVYQFWGAPSVTSASIAAWASLLPIRTDNLLVVGWTLRQEVTFYLVLATCLLPRIGPFILSTWVAATVTVWFITPIAFPEALSVIAGHLLSVFNFEFFAGLLAGWIFRGTSVPAGWAASALATGTALVAWRMSLDGWGSAYGPVIARPIYGIAYAAIILGAAGLERSGALRFGRLGSPMALAAGAISYPLYLSHLSTLDAVISAVGPSGIAARLGLPGTFILMVSIAVVVAALLAVLVDLPLQAALRRIGRARRQRVLSVPAPDNSHAARPSALR